MTITAGQFAALTHLLRVQQHATREAARLVLVDGMRPIDAAALQGVTTPALGNLLTRLRAGLELARQAANASESMPG